MMLNDERRMNEKLSKHPSWCEIFNNFVFGQQLWIEERAEC